MKIKKRFTTTFVVEGEVGESVSNEVPSNAVLEEAFHQKVREYVIGGTLGLEEWVSEMTTEVVM